MNEFDTELKRVFDEVFDNAYNWGDGFTQELNPKQLEEKAIVEIKEAFAKHVIGEDREQRLIHNGDDGESHDRFYRDGGYNFAKQEMRQKLNQQG